MERSIIKLLKLQSLHSYAKANESVIWEGERESIQIPIPEVYGSIRGTLSSGEVSCPPTYIAEVGDATVVGGSNFILTRDQKILDDELARYGTEEFGIKSKNIHHHAEGQVLVNYTSLEHNHKKWGILISCDHDSNYFHWLLECLPKVIMINEINRFPKFPFLITEGLHKNLEEAFHIVNRNHRRIEYLEKGTACEISTLIVPSAVSRILDRYAQNPVHDQDVVLSHRWTRKVSELLRSTNNPRATPGRKIYIRRDGSTWRVLVNQEEIENLLKKQGFEIVEFDQASLQDQISLCASASVIVAPTGAALTNMIYCNPHTKVFVLMSDHPAMNYYTWSNLGSSLGLQVEIIVGQRMYNKVDYYSVHDDYHINPSLLLRRLAAS